MLNENENAGVDAGVNGGVSAEVSGSGGVSESDGVDVVSCLSECKEMSKEIKYLKEKIDRLYSDAMFPKNQVITGMPGYHDFDGDTVGKTIIKIEELRELYQKKLCDLMEMQEKIESKIDRLPSRERSVMRYRYIDGYSWNKIGALMNYSVMHVHRIHKDALAMLAQ